jgi:hypothetical protein
MINFNSDPYYDDFDSTKNFHRILFKPGVSVQARELTQAQTILQDQITKFADNIFKRNSPVTGGQITTNFTCHYIKLQTEYEGVLIDVNDFDGIMVTDSTGEVIAQVLSVVEATGSAGDSDPPTLIVSYKSGKMFVDGDTIFSLYSNNNAAALAIASNSTGFSSVISITKGVFYVEGNFVEVPESTIVLSKYSKTPSARVGLEISETVYDYVDDNSLLDPALGASNFQAPGADRYVIKLTLSSRSLSIGSDQNFIELVRVINGSIYPTVQETQYSLINDYIAKREYESNGDYVVDDFKLVTKINTANADTYILNIGKGLAYIGGYRTENPYPVELVSNRSRTTASSGNHPVARTNDPGSYLYVNNVKGNTTFFDVTSTQEIDIHCVDYANISLSSTNSYNSTVVATAFMRNIEFNSSLGSSNTNNWVYKSYIDNVYTKTLTGNVVSSSANSVTFFNSGKLSSTNNAYTGVVMLITKGTNAGEFATIASYNGSTKTAYINGVWSYNPDNTSEFVFNFDIKDAESLTYTNKASYPAVFNSKANIYTASKVDGIPSGFTFIENNSLPELVYQIGNPFVNSLSDSSYYSTQTFRNVTFNATTGADLDLSTLNGVVLHEGSSSDTIKNNYIIIVTNRGTNTTVQNGDIISWDTYGVSATLSVDQTTLTLVTNLPYNFDAIVIAKVFITNANDSRIVKTKQLITANNKAITSTAVMTNIDGLGNTYVDDRSLVSTGQIYIKKAGIVNSGNNQSLYLSDVKYIKRIIDTKNPATAPTVAMLQNSSYDITNNYSFDDGQRDTYYDHASIKLIPGRPKPVGNILILVDYYQHGGGDGYFSKYSYVDGSSKPDDYRQIPLFLSSSGVSYNLRDCIDFRRVRKNALSTFSFNVYSANPNLKGAYIPTDSFVTDYSFYLERKDRLILNKDKSFQILEGVPSTKASLPTEPEGSLLIANLYHNPYTSYIPGELLASYSPDLSIEKLKHKRYRMTDIAGLENRINQVEYYTALSALEQSATKMQITDGYGLNRFKNGIMTDDFSSYSTVDGNNQDYNAAINRRLKYLTCSKDIKNVALKNIALVYNNGALSDAEISALSYKIHKDNFVNYYTLPYTSEILTSQPYATNELTDPISVNPFAISVEREGKLSLSPNYDNWIDDKIAASITLQGDFNIWKSTPGQTNLMYTGDYQTISGTTQLTSSDKQTIETIQERLNHGQFTNKEVSRQDLQWLLDQGYTEQQARNLVGYAKHTVQTTTTDTYTQTITQQQNNILGEYSKLNNTYDVNMDFVQDISIAPWIRAQEILVGCTGLKNTDGLGNYFDKINVDNYVRKPNVIKLTAGANNFVEGDVIGYYTNSTTFKPTAKVVGKSSSGDGTGLLYVISDGNNPNIISSNGNYGIETSGSNITIHVGKFDSTNAPVNKSIALSGVYTYGTCIHWGGSIFGDSAITPNNVVKLSVQANSSISKNMTGTDIVGNTFYIVAGAGAGSNATITGFNTQNRNLTLDKELKYATNDVYSIGKFSTDAFGKYFAIFNVPTGQFHSGQRVFRVDNRGIGEEIDSSTWAEGTFYSEGLFTQKTRLDAVSGSPSSLKNTLIATNERQQTKISTSTSISKFEYYNPYDPLAQTFMIDSKNYPRGTYLYSIKVFFYSIPGNRDNSSITLSIVGTNGGIPSGETLDHSIVIKEKKDVKRLSPSDKEFFYTSASAYTEFKFAVPVYIYPDKLYAFILKSESKEYYVHVAKNGSKMIPSTYRNTVTDSIPTNTPVIGTAPYIGSVFRSQNAVTWVTDPNESLMFVIDRCKFNITQNPSVRFIVPKGAPTRTLIEDSVNYTISTANVANTNLATSNSNILYDAFNVTTTDFVPPAASLYYEYGTLTKDNVYDTPKFVTPGKYGTALPTDIVLDDRRGERLLLSSNSSTSFSLDAILTSYDDNISPMISDAGITLYTIENIINNCELSDDIIIINEDSQGTGYNNTTVQVTVSSPTGRFGQTALAKANVTGGKIDYIYLTDPGYGYIETPTITVTDAATRSGNSNVSVIVNGETSASGGSGIAKYFTKKVVLDTNFDSEDLAVFLTAYRPQGTDIHVYYKIKNRFDTDRFENQNWQLMTKTRNSDSLYSKTRNESFEFSFAPGVDGVDQGYVSYNNTLGETFSPTSFSEFAIKILMTTSDKTFVPKIYDFRCIALPAKENDKLGKQ